MCLAGGCHSIDPSEEPWSAPALLRYRPGVIMIVMVDKEITGVLQSQNSSSTNII